MANTQLGSYEPGDIVRILPGTSRTWNRSAGKLAVIIDGHDDLGYHVLGVGAWLDRDILELVRPFKEQIREIEGRGKSNG